MFIRCLTEQRRRRKGIRFIRESGSSGKSNCNDIMRNLLTIIPILAFSASHGNAQDMPHPKSEREPATGSQSHQISSLKELASSRRRVQSLPQGEPCTSDFDCDSFACARSVADRTAERTCCDLDYVYAGPSLGNVCTNQPPGASCLDNRDELCESFVCVGGVCAADQQEDGDVCDNDQDCISRKCKPDAFGESTLGHCRTRHVDFTKAQAGEACEGRSDCANNVCGLPSLTNATAICCPSGEAASAVCTGQPIGAPCLDPRQLPDNRIPLDICESGYCCVPCGVCKERLETGEECQFDEDCVEGQCAPNGQGARICCPEVTPITGQCAIEVKPTDTSSTMVVGNTTALMATLTLALVSCFV